ncbi:hypothetical protein B0H16DRAFT_1452447 [Mycena metata]|uniref:Uncharacterized protein n=1 Tax=Mycena metata TaxID=1033252 RepID=A0AAD7JR55_9AGAR|nr:hypothetical protein B0H16DRAFT_1452447 [Mycena metata]
MEEVKEMEITEGTVGGIETTNGGADTDNAMEITGGGACADNVTEDEMEEGGGGEESTMMRCTASRRRRYPLPCWSRRREHVGSASAGARCSTPGAGCTHGCSSSLLLLGSESGRRAQTYPSGRGWWTPMLREDNVHEFDSAEVWEAERGGSGADEAGSVGWPRGHEYDGTCIIEGLCNVIGSSGGILSLNTAVAGAGSLHCRVGVKMFQHVVEKASGGDIFKSSGSIKWRCAASAGDIARGYLREADCVKADKYFRSHSVLPTSGGGTMGGRAAGRAHDGA